MLFVIKQADRDSSASATAGMAQEGDAGLRMDLQEERQELEEPVVGLGLALVQAPAILAGSNLRTSY